MKRTSFLGVSSKRSCRSSIEPFNFSFFSVTGWGIDLDYCDIEWFALETNRDHSVIFEIASKYCISDSFVGHGGYSISSADGDCSHEIKRRLLLGRKVMTYLDSLLKSRDITLPTKVRLVKAMVFPVVMYSCEGWTIKKAEHRRIDAF